MSKNVRNLGLALAGLLLLAVLAYQIPFVKAAVDWRIEKFGLYVKNTIDPPGPVPTALPTSTPAASLATKAPSATPEPAATATALQPPTATLAPLPAQVSLTPPAWERQSPNNCGPNTLAFALQMYGWTGTQANIADQIKPVTGDRNVNPEELAWYVRNNAGWLNIEYRVAGDVPLLKRLLAANYPVIVESVTALDPNDALGPSDDLWAAHYLLLTGYDDATQSFSILDSYHEDHRAISYAQLEADWKAFNNLYMVLYLPQEQAELQTLLGVDWDADANRQRALDLARAEAESNPADAFAWFNLGSDLVYFERYEEAALAYDQSREIGLPLRMFRYQFGPFIAYFQSSRIDDLLALTDYARGITDMSEETWLWYGWALYRTNDFEGARAAWNKALKVHPGYVDAEYALNFLTGQ